MIPDLDIWKFLIIAVVGIISGIINTIAGSGSLLTLPVFTFICGLPASVANATNRIGVLMQAFVASQKYYREKPEVFEGTSWLYIPAILGGIVGSKIAVDIDEKTMNLCLGILMLMMLILLLFKPERWLITDKIIDKNQSQPWYAYLVFFGVGVYGGFLQAGVGFFILAGLVLISKYSLAKSNALKLALTLIFTLPALIIFIYYQKVNFFYGILMGVFQAIGAYIGVNYIVKIPNANVWIYRALLVVVSLSALKFLLI